MSFKIVIQSHKRADRVTTKKLVHGAIICVEESQKAEYEHYNPECEIVAHPDDIKGLPAKKNWMLNHFKDCFMLDDDAVSFQKMSGMTANTIKDPSEVTRIIYNLREMAELVGAPLYGFTKIPRPLMYDEYKPYTFQKMVEGGQYGVFEKDNLFWNEDLAVKEDFWISCICKYYYRKILISMMYKFNFKDTFVNAGGLSETRNKGTERHSMLEIKKNFGKVIELKTENAHTKDKVKINIITKFGF